MVQGLRQRLYEKEATEGANLAQLIPAILLLNQCIRKLQRFEIISN